MVENGYNTEYLHSILYCHKMTYLKKYVLGTCQYIESVAIYTETVTRYKGNSTKNTIKITIYNSFYYW